MVLRSYSRNISLFDGFLSIFLSIDCKLRL